MIILLHTNKSIKKTIFLRPTSYLKTFLGLIPKCLWQINNNMSVLNTCILKIIDLHTVYNTFNNPIAFSTKMNQQYCFTVQWRDWIVSGIQTD